MVWIRKKIVNGEIGCWLILLRMGGVEGKVEMQEQEVVWHGAGGAVVVAGIMGRKLTLRIWRFMRRMWMARIEILSEGSGM
jgi:hypothetical protein